MKRKVLASILILTILALSLFSMSACLRFKGIRVTFYTQGGTPVPEVQILKSGDKIEKPQDPVKVGYEFLGWRHSDREWDFENDTVKVTSFLVAVWEKKTYDPQLTKLTGFDVSEDGTLLKNLSIKTDSYDFSNDIEVTEDCTWKAYKDQNCRAELRNNVLALNEGANTAYIGIYLPDGERAKVIPVIINRGE